MRFAVVTMSVAVLALGLCVSSVQAKTKRAEHLSHHGTFVSASAGKLVMLGRNGKEHNHIVAKDVKVTIDGKPGTLAALKKGTHVSVTTDANGNVTAVTTLAAVAATPPAPVQPAVTTKPTTPAKPASATSPATPTVGAKTTK